MWVIWFTQLQAAFFFQFFLGGGVPQGSNADTPMGLWLWAICLVPLVLATGVRWWVLPKIKPPAKQLVAMVVGLALAEVVVLLSIFLVAPDYPQYQIAILMVAVVAIIQFAPSYATPGYTKA